MTLRASSWEAYRRRNDCVEVYCRKLFGWRARIFNLVRRVGPALQFRYFQWLGAEILWNERTVEYFLASRMLPAPPCRVLDVGSASSRWPIQLASIGYQVSALDVRELGYEHPGVRFFRSGLFEWAPSDLFDCITAISAIEHFGLGHYGDAPADQADATAMDRLARWLAPGGTLILSVPYGLRGITPKHRIYDALALSALCRDYAVLEDRYFRREADAWHPCSQFDLADVASPGLPVNGVVVRKLTPAIGTT